jgi:hypothetical protein
MFDNAQNPHIRAHIVGEMTGAETETAAMALTAVFSRVETQKPGHPQGALIDGTILVLGTNLAKRCRRL